MIPTIHFVLHFFFYIAGVKAGVKALRQVLNKFSVNNRSNMFVVREKNGSVFYLRYVLMDILAFCQRLWSAPKKALSAYFTSKQILPFGFIRLLYK